MANTGITDLIPTYFANGFDEMDVGEYTLPMDVSRKFEQKVGNNGDTVTVPLVPSFSAKDYTPGSDITKNNVTQETVNLVLNKSKNVTFLLTDRELSLTLYELRETYAKPAMEALLAQVNTDIVTVMSGASSNADITFSSSIGATAVRSAKKKLDGQKVAQGRKLIIPSDYANDLLEDSEFKSLENLATPEILRDGIISKRYGFDIKMNHAMSAAGYAFHPSAVAFAARPYKEPEAGTGAKAAIGSYKGLPIRIVVKYTDELVLQVQFDILYGAKLIKGSRIVKITEASGSGS